MCSQVLPAVSELAIIVFDVVVAVAVVFVVIVFVVKQLPQPLVCAPGQFWLQ